MGLGGGGKTSTTTRQELSPEQQELLSLVIPAARDISENPPQLFPESQIAPFNPLQVAGQELALGAAAGPVTQLGQTATSGVGALQEIGLPTGILGAGEAIGGLDTAQPFLDFLLSGQALFPQSNPALAATAEAAIRPLEQSLTQQVLPGIRSGAVDAGQFGSSRQGIAEGIALQEFQQQAGDISANIFSQGFSDALAAATNALGTTQGLAGTGFETLVGQGTRSLFATPQLADLALQPAAITGGVGFQQQQQEQAQLSEEAQKFISEQIIPFLVAQDVAQLAFGIPGGSITSTTSGGGGGIQIGQLLGALVGGVGGAFVGGPAGAFAGAGLGQNLGGAFG